MRKVNNPCNHSYKHRFLHGGNNNGDCNGKEILEVKVNGVNYGGNMNWGPMTFTSDVSLPKDDKHICWGNKLQLVN